jgi:hypothetical protein
MNALTQTKIPIEFHDEVLFLKLAREIACDIRPLDAILKMHSVEEDQWAMIYENPRFRELVRSAVAEWQSATNTPERVKIKAMSFVEEALPEFYGRAHDPKELLSAKVEVLKTVAKLAGMGENSQASSGGDRMTVTINLGADHQLKIEKNLGPIIEQTE